MDSVNETQEHEFASEISSKHLPPVTYRDLPEPIPLRWIIGPGVILAATGLGSGEFVLWPFIAAQGGLEFLWAALFGSIIMFFIATECVRYTVSTGETIITGFTRLWRPWWVVFLLMAIVPNFWPGFATGTATTLTFILGGGNVLLITILALIAITLSLTLSPVIYQFMEKAQTVMLIVMGVFLLFVVVITFTINASAWGELVRGLGSVGSLPEGVAFPTLAGAAAFTGSGGLGVIVISNYIRDKNLGMGYHIPRLVSPITGQEEAGSNIGHFFPQNEENLRRWRGWWRVTNWEQFLTYFLFTIVAICLMSLLAYATVFGQNVGEGFDFIRAEGLALGEIVGPWFANFFWIAGTLALFSTNLGAWDFVGRISADLLKANLLRESRFWSESRVYAAIIISLFVFAVIALGSGLQQPVVLIVIQGVLNGAVAFVYCALMIQLNRFSLPDSIKMGKARLVIISLAFLFYGFFFVVTILDLLGVFGG